MKKLLILGAGGYGKTIAECPAGEVAQRTAEIDMTALEAFREKFPVLRDADI